MPNRGSRASGQVLVHRAGFAFSALALTLAAVGAHAGIRFKDVSVEAGFDTHVYQSPSRHALGVNWIDVDDDGWADLFVVDGFRGTPHLYMNQRDGTFASKPEYLPELPHYDMTGSVFADYDNDGDSDIYVYTDNEQFELHGLNVPDGPPNLLLKNLFVENGRIIRPGTPLFEDVADAVGLADRPDEPLGDYSGFRAKSATWLDYDRDGCVDLYVGHMVFQADGDMSNRDRMYKNRCNGTFEDVTDSLGFYSGDTNEYRPTLAVVAGHFNGDLWPDLYVAHASPAVEGLYLPEGHFDRVFKNDGGTFVEMEFEGVGDDAQAAMGIDFADVDRDGDWDLYISDMYSHLVELEVGPPGNPLYLNDGGERLLDNSSHAAGVAGGDSWGVNFLDADQDGHEDLFVSTFGGAMGLSYFYRNLADGTFEDLSTTASFQTGDARGSACADYDNDGDVDLALVNQDGVLQLFRNETSDAGNWIQVELIGVESNADAIGSIVTVSSLAEASDVQMRQIKGGSSAHSQDSFVTHFGLGTVETVKVKVEWPSGAVDIHSLLSANRRHILVEGEVD